MTNYYYHLNVLAVLGLILINCPYNPAVHKSIKMVNVAPGLEKVENPWFNVTDTDIHQRSTVQ
jgi:hypothetical protein